MRRRPLLHRLFSKSTAQYQVVAIRRGDTGSWAIPGGMVEQGEEPDMTMLREFGEEALGLSEGAVTPTQQSKAIHAILDRLFAFPAMDVYQGYVDDPRNTDNAWVETICKARLIPNGVADHLPLRSGSDAAQVRWLDLDAKLLSPQNDAVYASHREMLAAALAVVEGKRSTTS